GQRLVRDDDGARHLERGEALGHVGLQLLGREVLPGDRHHGGGDLLAEAPMGDTEHGGSVDVWMLVERSFDLGASHVLAAPSYHTLRSAIHEHDAHGVSY